MARVTIILNPHPCTVFSLTSIKLHLTGHVRPVWPIEEELLKSRFTESIQPLVLQVNYGQLHAADALWGSGGGGGGGVGVGGGGGDPRCTYFEEVCWMHSKLP